MSREYEVVAKRYAEALFDLANENQIVSQIEDELAVVKEVFNKNPQLMEFFRHPKVTTDEKKKVIFTSFGELSDTVRNTMLLLADRNRIEITPELIDQYTKLANDQQGVAAAKVYSVNPLSDEEQARISDVFAKRVGKEKLSIENVVDPDLIGGIKVRIGNRIFDGSVSGKLERMKRQLVSAKG
ncbi:F0F1 ATP synthase subunit delta [Pseudalkalibacillus caeni]|uniref:ATP synthase subunit delta n=1 Tax=Exobacillus caeni TaxID=2574798 RepID=A0A5R9F7W5_9BACL|nr:F0F1 ATP synthase subunit delta [Pseudalkalibacillus caeni]TLS35835.1 F0F1 ATP synthase subunit delta [Pseudalkalibacillus caeni]